MGQFNINFAAGQPAPLTGRGPKKKINAAPTQKRSYHEEVAFGRLKGRKAEILTMLKDGASVSCREAAMILGTFPNCLTAAFKQLEEAGHRRGRRKSRLNIEQDCFRLRLNCVINFIKARLDPDTMAKLRQNPALEFKGRFCEKSGEVLEYPGRANLPECSLKSVRRIAVLC